MHTAPRREITLKPTVDLKPLVLTYAQIEFLFEAGKDARILNFSEIRKRLGWFKVAEALREKGVITKRGGQYGFSFYGWQVLTFVLLHQKETKGRIIELVKQNFARGGYD